MYKFERLEVYQLALDYIEQVYTLAERLPAAETYNLGSQIRRAATSIALNVAEGSTGQSDPEQGRFLGLALRSLLETVACQHIIQRRGYVKKCETLLAKLEESGRTLARKLQAMRKSLAKASI
jgi:four helix bundle protein